MAPSTSSTSRSWSVPLSPVVLQAGLARTNAGATRARSRGTRLRSIDVRYRYGRLRRSQTGPVMAMAVDPATQSAGQRRPASVLVVDDDDGVRRSLAEVLGCTGHRVTEARDGDEALAILRRERMDVLILDMRMPRRDGVEVLRELDRPPPAVIVHSAKEDFVAAEIRELFRARVVTSLRKPVPPHMLVAAVEEAALAVFPGTT